MRLPLSFVAFAVLCASSMIFAEDVFQFRGENSQGKYNEPGLLDSWPEDGLKPKWLNTELGEGWSSVIKVKDRLYLNCFDSNDAKKESVVCMDLNGKKIWQKPVGAITNRDHNSPRTTPTYVDDKLVVLSGAGELFCLAAANGDVLWNKNVAADYETKFGNWGMAENVATKDGKVFVTAGGKKALVVAYNLADGSVAWTTEPLDDNCAYVAPVLYEDKLITVTAKYVAVIDTKTGELVWKDDFIASTGGAARMGGIHCNAPLIKGNQFFVTQGYGQGCAMYEFLSDGKAKLLWGNKGIDTHHHGVVEVDGRIYGSNFRGQWCCVDWKTGETVYGPEGWKGKGVTIFADGKLFMYAEGGGTLAIAKPSDKFEITSSFQIDFGTAEHWSHPVISDGVLYVRHGNSLAAYDITKK